MEVKALLKHQRIAPRKVRLIADLVRGKEVERAKKELLFSSKRAALPVLKLLNSAIANAKNNLEVKEEDVEKLFVKKIIVDEGPSLKRWRPVSRGTAHEIQKRTSHITLVLAKKEKETSDVKSQKTNKEKLKNLKDKN